jgi:hypothetical protein
LNADDRDRLVMARSLMWNAASSDEQTYWLAAADQMQAHLRDAIESARSTEPEEWPDGAA